MENNTGIINLKLLINPRPQKEGLLQPPKIFLRRRFLPNNCWKRFYIIVFYIYYASFDVYEVKFGGCRLGMGVVKDYGRGVGEIP